MIATRNGFEVLCFPVMQSSFSFTYVELLTVPTASLVNNTGHLSTGESVFVIQRFTTSEDVCWNIRNVKIKPFFFPEMRLYFLIFITAVCFLFLLKLRWPKNKSI